MTTTNNFHHDGNWIGLFHQSSPIIGTMSMEDQEIQPKNNHILTEKFHEETKNMWKWNLFLRITILYHPSCHCLEVITAEDSHQYDMGHIFVDYIKLSHKFSNEEIADQEVYSTNRTKQSAQPHQSPHNTKTIALHKLMAKYITDRIHLESDNSQINHHSQSNRADGNHFHVTLCPIAGDATKLVDGYETLDIICAKPKALHSFGDLLSDADKQLQRELEKAHLTEAAEVAFRSHQERLREEDDLSDLSDQEDESLKKWEIKRVARRVLEKSVSDDGHCSTQQQPSEITLSSSSLAVPSFDITANSHSTGHSLLPDIEVIHTTGFQFKKKTPRRSFDQTSAAATLCGSTRSSFGPCEEMSFASSGLTHSSVKTVSTSSSSSSSTTHHPNKLPSLRIVSFNNRNVSNKQKSNKIDSLVEGIAVSKLGGIPPEDIPHHIPPDFSLH